MPPNIGPLILFVLLLVLLGVFVCCLTHKIKQVRRTHFSTQWRIRSRSPARDNDLDVYWKSEYFRITRNSFSTVQADPGKYGEYLVYRRLLPLEDLGARFLFNLYLPQPDGTTTEIDVIAVTSQGLFVVESKNFHGYIFGHTEDDYWVQEFTDPRYNAPYQECFYNPILQNKVHIEALRKILTPDVPVFSLIVFSDNCSLAGVTNINPTVRVTHLRRCLSIIVDTIDKQREDTGSYITEDGIYELYNLLYPYTQVSQEVKDKHIRDHHNAPN